MITLNTSPPSSGSTPAPSAATIPRAKEPEGGAQESPDDQAPAAAAALPLASDRPAAAPPLDSPLKPAPVSCAAAPGRQQPASSTPPPPLASPHVRCPRGRPPPGLPLRLARARQDGPGPRRLSVRPGSRPRHVSVRHGPAVVLLVGARKRRRPRPDPFTRSKISYIDAPEAVFDESPSAESPPLDFRPPLTRPHSKLHGFWFPPDSFRGWKQIPLLGKCASRSCEDLHKLRLTWDDAASGPPAKKPPGSYSRGQSPLETLPSEVLVAIIDLLVVEIPPNGLTTRNADLMALLLTSRSIHAATLNTLYRHITIPHSRIFRKFLTTITAYPALATIVRRLDFSHFNPSIIFSTASERAKTQNLTADNLAQCLQLTPFLHEFLAQEYVDDDLGPAVLRKLLFDMPQLRALDFCGCSSAHFRSAFKSIFGQPWPDMLSLTKLSFHKCLSLPSAVFETILPRLARLTHLDVAGTQISDEALEMILSTARLTHLNLAKCKELSSQVVIKFTTTHPAATQSLVFLSLATDSTNHLLLGKEDVDTLLPRLPPTLKSLSLRGSRMHASHLPQLIRLAQTLEELAVGRGLDMDDIHRIFRHGETPSAHSLHYLDISEIDTIIGSASALLSPLSAPLSVIEINERAYERAAKLHWNLDKVGWTSSESGCRYWLVRKPTLGRGLGTESQRRWWKMGVESWGMRKVPVAVAEVGGMYGSFMFGRRL